MGSKVVTVKYELWYEGSSHRQGRTDRVSVGLRANPTPDPETVAIAFLEEVHFRRKVRDLAHCSAANLKICLNTNPPIELKDQGFFNIIRRQLENEEGGERESTEEADDCIFRVVAPTPEDKAVSSFASESLRRTSQVEERIFMTDDGTKGRPSVTAAKAVGFSRAPDDQCKEPGLPVSNPTGVKRMKYEDSIISTVTFPRSSQPASETPSLRSGMEIQSLPPPSFAPSSKERSGSQERMHATEQDCMGEDPYQRQTFPAADGVDSHLGQTREQGTGQIYCIPHPLPETVERAEDVRGSPGDGDWAIQPEGSVQRPAPVDAPETPAAAKNGQQSTEDKQAAEDHPFWVTPQAAQLQRSSMVAPPVFMPDLEATPDLADKSSSDVPQDGSPGLAASPPSLISPLSGQTTANRAQDSPVTLVLNSEDVKRLITMGQQPLPMYAAPVLQADISQSEDDSVEEQGLVQMPLTWHHADVLCYERSTNPLPGETPEHFSCRQWLTASNVAEIEKLWREGIPGFPSMQQVESSKESQRRRGYDSQSQRQRRSRQFKVILAIDAVAEALRVSPADAALVIDQMVSYSPNSGPKEFASLSNLAQARWPVIVEKIERGLGRYGYPMKLNPKRKKKSNIFD